ncbi:MAG: hypothetical protein H6709_22130 [Kofleriaceae bacterium]|nr:hypothetical protein [Kofleriaceae bacterium]
MMPRLELDERASLAVDYLGAAGGPEDAQGVSALLGYQRPIAGHLALTAEAGLAWAQRGSRDGTSLTDLTIGGAYQAGAATVARLALILPLASDEGDAAIPAAVHGALRVADGERFDPTPVTVRLAGGHRWVGGKAFVQVDAGADARLGADDERLRLRLGIAGGVRAIDRVWVVGELTTVSSILDPGAGEDFRHVLDLGLRVDVPRGVAGVRLQVPLDRSLRAADVYVAGFDYLVRFQ